MAESGIRDVAVLHVETDIGTCEINLCVGDITALKKRDKVDVLVISAFPGDYTPTARSLVGQLLKLGVNVRQLSQDKEEDLRALYSCWWSKPLPENLSFGRLLCFEGSFKKGKKMGEVVGDVFRCLVPVLANREGMVIMPLLATGDQGYSKPRMLKLLVKAAVKWMKAGLPLRSLKIVLFSRDISKISKADEPLVNLFEDYKKAQEKAKKGENRDVVVHEFDVYLSYSEKDARCITDIMNCLKKNRSGDLRIFSSIQELDKEDSWQEKLYATITKCQRVMALITPSYLQSSRCTEQYNIALCHSRKIHQSVLVPLYISEVPYMPTYMKLTQYIDCRIDYMNKINVACVTVTSCLTITTTDKNDNKEAKKPSPDNYDVFLSYSHCNDEVAQQIVKDLRTRHPNITIFIDTAELKAGGVWQQTLYQALDHSKIVITLISNDYMRSKVCQEELSLAIALHQQNQCKVIPLIIEQVKENLDWLKDLCPMECFATSAEKEGTSISTACEMIIRELNDSSSQQTTGSNTTPLTILLEEVRSLLFQREYRFESMFISTNANSDVTIVTEVVPAKQKTSNGVDIYILSCAEDIDYCQLLIQLIHAQDPSLVIKTTSDGNTSDRLGFLDDARLIISLLSNDFASSSELLHELNITWCRQRNSEDLCFLAIIIGQLPSRPTYLHLLPSFFNCEDEKWQKQQALAIVPAKELLDVFSTSPCPLKAVLCLLAAAKHISQWLQGQDVFVCGLQGKFSNPLFTGICVQLMKEQRSSLENNKQDTGVMVVTEQNTAPLPVTPTSDVTSDSEIPRENVAVTSDSEIPRENVAASVDTSIVAKKNEGEELQGNSHQDVNTEQLRENDEASVGESRIKVNEQVDEQIDEQKVVANEKGEDLPSNSGEVTDVPNILPKLAESNICLGQSPQKSARSASSSSTCLLI